MKPADPTQPLFSFLPEIIPQGGGGFLVKPGRPVQWVDTELAAKHLQVDASTLRGWIQTGVLPERLADSTVVYRKRSPKLWEFNLPAIEQLRAQWTRTALA